MMQNDYINRESSDNGNLDDAKQELFEYINRRIKLFKLDVYEKTSIIASELGYVSIVFCLAFIVLFFTFFTLGFFLGELLNSQAAGFGILVIVYLLALIIVIMLRKRIKMFFLNKVLVFMQKLETVDNENDNYETDGTK